MTRSRDHNPKVGNHGPRLGNTGYSFRIRHLTWRDAFKNGLSMPALPYQQDLPQGPPWSPQGVWPGIHKSAYQAVLPIRIPAAAQSPSAAVRQGLWMFGDDIKHHCWASKLMSSKEILFPWPFLIELRMSTRTGSCCFSLAISLMIEDTRKEKWDWWQSLIMAG